MCEMRLETPNRLLHPSVRGVGVVRRFIRLSVEKFPTLQLGKFMQNDLSRTRFVFVYRVGPLHSRCLASRANG